MGHPNTYQHCYSVKFVNAEKRTYESNPLLSGHLIPGRVVSFVFPAHELSLFQYFVDAPIRLSKNGRVYPFLYYIRTVPD